MSTINSKVYIANLNVFPDMEVPHLLAQIAKIEVENERLRVENEKLRKEKEGQRKELG